MAWRVDLSAAAERHLGKLNPVDAKRIAKTLRQIAALDDPRQRGKALTGEYAGLWRYRVADWRVIAKIEDRRLVIVVIALGHRREVYRC